MNDAGLNDASTGPTTAMDDAAFHAHRPITPDTAPATPTVPTTDESVPLLLSDHCRPTMTQKAMKGITTSGASSADPGRTSGTLMVVVAGPGTTTFAPPACPKPSKSA